MLRQSFQERIHGLSSLKSLILFSELTRAKPSISRNEIAEVKRRTETWETCGFYQLFLLEIYLGSRRSDVLC